MGKRFKVSSSSEAGLSLEEAVKKAEETGILEIPAAALYLEVPADIQGGNDGAR